MKLHVMALALFGSCLVAMENPNPGKRKADEPIETLQGESKARHEELIEEIEYPLASLAGLPVELKAKIFNYLITALGTNKDEQLLNASLNIRNFLQSNKQFKESLDDEILAGEIIVQLASRYANNDVVKAAIVFSTNAASKWLANQIKERLPLNPDGTIKTPLSEADQLFKDNIQKAIQFAFNNNRFEILRFLFAYEPILVNKYVIIREDDTPINLPLLEGAVALNNFKMVDFLLKYDARITDNAIMRAATEDSPKMLKLLAEPITHNGIVVSPGTDFNKRFEGDTLLFFAVNKDMVDYLTSKGLNVNARNNNKRTPLHQAIIDSHYQVADALLDKGADPHLEDNYGNTPLHLLASKKVLIMGVENDIFNQMLAHMLEKTINFEIKNKLGNTPLAVAIIAYNTKIAELLLQHGAQLPENVYVTRQNEAVIVSSPLKYFMSIPKHINIVDLVKMINLLIAHGAHVNELVIDPISGEQITLLGYLKTQRWMPPISVIMSLLKSHGAHE